MMNNKIFTLSLLLIALTMVGFSCQRYLPNAFKKSLITLEVNEQGVVKAVWPRLFIPAVVFPEDGVIVINDDQDGDGLAAVLEKQIGTNPLISDTDNDGLTDHEEYLIYSTNPLLSDTDVNGVNDAEEVKKAFQMRGEGEIPAILTPPTFIDNDQDDIDDVIEKIVGTSAKKADTDGDGLTDGQEFFLQLHPLKKDTDGDGVNDGKELELGTDPHQPN